MANGILYDVHQFEKATVMTQIVHLITSISRASAGLGTVVSNLAQTQSTLGSRTSIWCFDDATTAQLAIADHALHANLLRLYAAPHLGHFWFSHKLWRDIVDAQNSVTLVHQHGIWTNLSVYTNHFRKQTGRPVVLAPHGSLEPVALSRSSYKKRLALWGYEAENLDKADCLHALSHKEAHEFRQYGLKQPIAMVPNGISSAWLRSAGTGEDALQQFGIPNDRRLMLFLSRLHPIKGLPLLLRALHNIRLHLADWLLVIAGPDGAHYQAELNKLVQQLQLEDYVKFIGPVFAQDKRNLYAASELFVLPSLSEGAPMVVLEALGASLPVLTTHGTDWKEIEDYGCGWWVTVSVETIAEALLQAISLVPDELQQMGRRGRQLVEQQYTWEIMAEQMNAVYQWLLGFSESPPDCVLCS